MMALKSLLQELVKNTPGALGSLIITKEGNTIAEYNRLTPTDIDLFAAEYARLCGDIDNIISQMNMGKVIDWAIKTDQLYIFAHYVESHFLVLITLPETRRGEAQFRLNSFGPRVALEIC